MSRTKVASKETLELLLRGRGPISGPEIAANLKISQPTLSRLVRETSETVLRLEVGRPPLYALKRQVRGLGNPIPIFKINEQGKSIPIGTLTSIHPHGYVYQDSDKPTVFNGIPFFLSDNRPQGFIGKTFPIRNSDLKLPTRTHDWSEDDFMEAICRRGEDNVGNIIAGRESFERFQQQRLNRRKYFSSSEALENYINFANNSLASEYPGSSAAGEQPKFTASYTLKSQVTHVLVKFSPKIDTPSNRRWADLLIAEHIASKILNASNIEACKSRILEGNNRIFLETNRFDRIGPWGRIGVISLASLDDEYWGKRDSWFAASFRMEKDAFVNAADAKKMRILSSFSDLIGNTDKHFGNLSFFFEPKSKSLKLTPAYDILPMMYAPSNNELVEREFRIPTPSADDVNAWELALPLAIEFWKNVTDHNGISKNFRSVAKGNLKLLKSIS